MNDYYDTPDRCYCSSNGECAYCLREVALAAEFPYGECATDDCYNASGSEGWCYDCIENMVHQAERMAEL